MLGFDAALAAHEPQIVLSSWMPMGRDWTAAVRRTPSVREYVLIGEADYGICGDPWLTWGFRGGGFGAGGEAGSESDGSDEGSGGDGSDAGGVEGDEGERRGKRCACILSLAAPRPLLCS